MVDVQGRQAAIDAITRFFVHAETTNFRYMNEYPPSKDPAVRCINLMLWGMYSDVREHKMVEKHSLSPEALDIVNRCILFLQTCRNYEWDSRLFSIQRATRAWRNWFSRVVTHTPASSAREQLKIALSDEPKGDAEVWPFYRAADYEEAQLGVSDR